MQVREYIPPVYQDWNHAASPITMPCAPWETGKPFVAVKPRLVIEAKSDRDKKRAARAVTILTHLRKGGWHTARDVAQALHLSGPETANSLLALVSAGKAVSKPVKIGGTLINRYAAVSE